MRRSSCGQVALARGVAAGAAGEGVGVGAAAGCARRRRSPAERGRTRDRGQRTAAARPRRAHGTNGSPGSAGASRPVSQRSTEAPTSASGPSWRRPPWPAKRASSGACSRVSFYEPGGLAVAGDKLYVADTNNHAIRVVDLKTKQTKTLPMKGLQPPQSAETEMAEAPPNQEEIKLAPQKLRTGDVSILVNVQLPPGYHLNPMAPHRYKISIEGGSSLLNIDSQNSGRTLKNPTLPIRIPARATAHGPG